MRKRTFLMAVIFGLPGFILDVARAFITDRLGTWGNQQVDTLLPGLQALVGVLKSIVTTPLVLTIAPPLFYLAYAARHGGLAAEANAGDKPEAGWILQQLQNRGYDPGQLNQVSELCAIRLSQGGIETRWAAIRLFDDGDTRAALEHLYMQELPNSRNATNVRDALGLCRFGPGLHHAWPWQRSKVRREIAEEIRAHRRIEEAQSQPQPAPPKIQIELQGRIEHVTRGGSSVMDSRPRQAFAIDASRPEVFVDESHKLAWWHLQVVNNDPERPTVVARAYLDMLYPADATLRRMLWSSGEGPVEEVELRYGAPPTLVPLVVRTTAPVWISGDPTRLKQFQLLPGAARITDHRALLFQRDFLDLPAGSVGAFRIRIRADNGDETLSPYLSVRIPSNAQAPNDSFELLVTDAP